MVNHFVVCQSFDGKLYVFPIEHVFEYSHHSKPENHSSVTFSEKQEVYDVLHKGLSRGNESSNCYCYKVIP